MVPPGSLHDPLHHRPTGPVATVEFEGDQMLGFHAMGPCGVPPTEPVSDVGAFIDREAATAGIVHGPTSVSSRGVPADAR
jgi:hypothetical protein